MKKIFVLTSLAILVFIANTANLNAAESCIGIFCDLEEQPVAMMVGCPPGVPCGDDGGGGSGGSSYNLREDNITYTSHIKDMNWTNTLNQMEFSSSDYQYIYDIIFADDTMYIPKTSVIESDSCKDLGPYYFKEGTNFRPQSIPLDTTTYFFETSGLTRVGIRGDLYLYPFTYQVANGYETRHDVYEMHDKCRDYEVVSNEIVTTDSFKYETRVMNTGPTGNIIGFSDRTYIPIVHLLEYYESNIETVNVLDFTNVVGSITGVITAVATYGASSGAVVAAEATLATTVAGVAATSGATVSIFLGALAVDDILVNLVHNGLVTDFNSFLNYYKDLDEDYPENVLGMYVIKTEWLIVNINGFPIPIPIHDYEFGEYNVIDIYKGKNILGEPVFTEISRMTSTPNSVGYYMDVRFNDNSFLDEIISVFNIKLGILNSKIKELF